MTRDQAKAIMQNIDLIRHFAQGGEIGHRLIDASGNQVAIYPSNKIVLTNMSPSKHCLYVKVKTRLRWDKAIQGYVRAPRYWPEKKKKSRSRRSCNDQ